GVARGRPPRDVATHGHEDEAEPAHGRGGGFGQRRGGWNHRFQQWQRQTGAHRPQKRSSRQRFLRDDHKELLMVNGVLWTRATMTAESRKSFACASRTIWRMAGASEGSTPRPRAKVNNFSLRVP